MKEEIIFDALCSGDRFVLSKAITLVESEDLQKKQKSNDLLKQCIPFEGRALRIGVTGAPGVGKSTFINAFASVLLTEGLKVAVLAIDPSSEETKGSILGDKTRMQDLIHSDDVFIRPSANKGSLGGISQSAYKTCLLFDASGYDVILIETVGVGQSEIVIQHLVDIVLLISIAGAGDDLQGIKKGILEIAQFLVLNKVENPLDPKVITTLSQLKSAFSLYHDAPAVFTCSSEQKQGIVELWHGIQSKYPTLANELSLKENRKNKKNAFIKHAWVESWREKLTQHSFYKAHEPINDVGDHQTIEELIESYHKEFLARLKVL